ncbi:MAG: hypothetical protein FWC26_04335 [Fibromonadales bacterium]|nr:hypothetical protein [Fibromonadales bacterium]
MAKKIKKKPQKKPAVPASQGVSLGDLLGKKLENVKRESEEKQKKMIKEARSNPAVLRSSEKFSSAKPKSKPAKQ